MSDVHTPATETDPRRALRLLIERGEGTSAGATMLRLLWLRREHPEANVSTEVVEMEDDVVVIRASILLGNGAAGSGISAEHLTDEREWGAAVERTETNAIARALDTLGYVLEASMPWEAGPAQPAPVQAPPAHVAASEPAQLRSVPRPEPAPVVAEPELEPETEPERRPGPVPVTSTPEEREASSPPPLVSGLRRIDRRPAAPQPVPAVATPDADEDHLEDYSWTAFWRRARQLGFDKPKIEERIGRPIHDLSPRQVRAALEESGVDFGD